MKLIFNPFSPISIVKLCMCRLGSSGTPPAPAAPDYTAIANSNQYASDKAYQTASDKLAFDKQVYSDAQPYVQQQQQNAVALGKEQSQIANTNQKSADLQLQQFQDKGIPAENQMYEDAANYGNAADQETQAGIASNQVQQQSDQARQQAELRLSDSGINPNSGAAVAMNRVADMNTAAQSANAANTARTAARDKGIALRAGAANFATGSTNAAATGFSTSIAAGNSSTGQYTSAANAGLPSAGIVDGGYGTGLGAAQLGSQAALGMGNVLNTGYGISMNGYNAALNANAQSSAGFGSMVGGLASAGAMMAMA